MQGKSYGAQVFVAFFASVSVYDTRVGRGGEQVKHLRRDRVTSCMTSRKPANLSHLMVASSLSEHHLGRGVGSNRRPDAQALRTNRVLL